MRAREGGPKVDNIVLGESGRDRMVSEPDPDRKCANEDAGPQGGWIVRPVSWGNKNGEQSHIARGEKGEVLKCVGTSLPSTRPFGSSLASNS